MQTKKLMIRKNEKTVKTSEKKVVFRRRYVRDTAATRTLCAMKYLLRIFFSVPLTLYFESLRLRVDLHLKRESIYYHDSLRRVL